MTAERVQHEIRPKPAELEHLRRTVAALRRENNSLRLLATIHDRLGALVLQGEDAASITAVLAALLQQPVLLLDPLLQPVVVELGPIGSEGPAGTLPRTPKERGA